MYSPYKDLPSEILLSHPRMELQIDIVPRGEQIDALNNLQHKSKSEVPPRRFVEDPKIVF